MFSDPQRNVTQFHLVPGAQVADFGAGPGFYTIPLARVVGGGKVHAIEVQKDMLAKLKSNAHGAHVTNVEYLWGDIERVGGTHLADGSMDAVVAANIIFQVTDKAGMIKEAHRILKTGGRIFLIDWKESYGGIGPMASQVVPEIKAKELLDAHGFGFERTISAGEHHYGLVYKKK